MSLLSCQLMEVMARLDAVESDLRTEKIEHKNDVERLNIKTNNLTKAEAEAYTAFVRFFLKKRKTVSLIWKKNC